MEKVNLENSNKFHVYEVEIVYYLIETKHHGREVEKLQSENSKKFPSGKVKLESSMILHVHKV